MTGFGIESVGRPEQWVWFTILVLGLLCVDLFVFHRKSHEVHPKEALFTTLFWIGLAGAANFLIYLKFGREPALQFLTGYVIEQSLSVDNLFVFILILNFFAVPKQFQHRVLFFGILGALVMRAGFILLGATLIQRFDWIDYAFGAVLILSGMRLTFGKLENFDPGNSHIVRAFRKLCPVVPDYRGRSFFVHEDGRLCATPLFLVLLCLEFSDLIFAVDSIPAIFAITDDPFIVFTSNIFAILGLRSMYFLLSGVLESLRYLNLGLAMVLTFVGVKMFISNFWEIPTTWSLLVVSCLIGVAVVASLLNKEGVEIK
jgi:tellurite resistance protein TerC